MFPRVIILRPYYEFLPEKTTYIICDYKSSVLDINCSHLLLDEYQTITFHHLISKGQQQFDLSFLGGRTATAGAPYQYQRTP